MRAVPGAWPGGSEARGAGVRRYLSRSQRVNEVEESANESVLALKTLFVCLWSSFEQLLHSRQTVGGRDATERYLKVRPRFSSFSLGE